MQERRWQYKVETVKLNPFSSPQKHDALIQERLNRLSVEGWDFVEMVASYGKNPQIIMRK